MEFTEKVTVTLLDSINYNFIHALSHQNTGYFASATGIVFYFSTLNAAQIVSILASFGSMALGIGFMGMLTILGGNLWNKFWSKCLNL